MPYNYSKLKGRIIEKFGKYSAFAEAMGMSERSMSLKINGKVAWKQPEMLLACELLGIPLVEIKDYFFDLKVQSIEQIGASV